MSERKRETSSPDIQHHPLKKPPTSLHCILSQNPPQRTWRSRGAEKGKRATILKQEMVGYIIQAESPPSHQGYWTGHHHQESDHDLQHSDHQGNSSRLRKKKKKIGEKLERN